MFKTREEAGKLLASKIANEDLITHPQQTVVLGIARGGILLARIIADKFNLKLDVIVVKKLSAPNQPELAIGAIGETEGSHFLEKNMINQMGISTSYLQAEIERKLHLIKKRESYYRQHHPAFDLTKQDVIIVDDGTATGATVIAAAREVWNQDPHKVIIALPLAPKDTLLKLEQEVDSVVVLETPEPFFAVGQFYQEFPQLADEEVLNVLKSNQ